MAPTLHHVVLLASTGDRAEMLKLRCMVLKVNVVAFVVMRSDRSAVKANAVALVVIGDAARWIRVSTTI
ncbi:hypothetical protein [Rosistilla oblonga]|uniref:hypothetical protein n=1 Tax=Rosistilla oblonga TaxID=2527990 RepID=UPI0011A5B304|nr:hypothetical protein [Rosistilla oblonga]